jgi:hypothetical protein
MLEARAESESAKNLLAIFVFASSSKFKSGLYLK